MNVKKTREAILDSSVQIFNEKKTSKVSTVQIADYMGISPGNLYYYFHNKEEIVRCIWHERIMKDLEQTRNYPLELEDGHDMVKMLNVLVDHISRYYFFYSEVSTLLHNDALLTEELTEVKKNNLKNLYTFVERVSKDGLFELESVEERIRAADTINAMICKAFCGNFAYSFDIDDRSGLKGIFLVDILMTIRPYCTEKCWSEMLAELGEKGIDFEDCVKTLQSQFL